MKNSLSKRLLTASRLGITFDYGDNHTWINFSEETANSDTVSLAELLERNKIIPACKNYLGIIGALDYIDSLLFSVGFDSLEKQFDNYNDWFKNEKGRDYVCNND